MDHAVSTVDGKVPADEVARLTALHGAEAAAEIVAEVEARWAPSAAPARRKPTNNGLKPRRAAAPPAADAPTETPTSEIEE